MNTSQQSKEKEIQEKDIDYPDIPELDDSFWDNAEIKYSENKKAVTLRLDRDVLDWFKSTGRGYKICPGAFFVLPEDPVVVPDGFQAALLTSPWSSPLIGPH